MNCCAKCFTSTYLIEILPAFSYEKGICDFCKSVNIELTPPKRLFSLFSSIIELYKPTNDPIEQKKFNALPIEEKILFDFPNKIFSFTDPELIRRFLLFVIEEEKDTYGEYLQQPVFLKYLNDPIINKLGSELKISWDIFAKEIKTINRYHLSNAIELKKMEGLLENIEKTYKKDFTFFRARISDKTGFDIGQMGMPPNKKAKGGRANPEGIPYLYLSNNVDTTIFEVRANLYDYITIGQFKLTDDIKVINLRNIEEYDPMPFAEEENLENFLIYLPFVEHLEDELSKPVRKNENEIDYVPTQYLSEFIKYLGFDGIEYKSSQHSKGYNIALFSDEKIKCINTFVEEVTMISYTHS